MSSKSTNSHLFVYNEHNGHKYKVLAQTAGTLTLENNYGIAFEETRDKLERNGYKLIDETPAEDAAGLGDVAVAAA